MFLVCDRFVAYKCLARELDGKLVLCFCWVHQRRDFIECAARSAETDPMVPAMDRTHRVDLPAERGPAGSLRSRPATPIAVVRRRAARAERGTEDLFAEAERELDGLEADAREAKPLRSLLRHREGLSVFLDNPCVPMDNNAAERALRSAVIGRRLSFGSDSEGRRPVHRGDVLRGEHALGERPRCPALAGGVASGMRRQRRERAA